MVVWIAWWACVDVLFHVLFHIKPQMVVSDACQCVPHPNHHQTHRSAVGPSCIHFASCQSPTTPCLSPCHTHKSITLLPQLSFLLLNVVFFIVIVLVTIERVCCCDGTHHSFAPTINTLCVCVTLVPSSVTITLLWCFGCGACCSPFHCASHKYHIWTVGIVEWHTRGFTQSTCHPLYQPPHVAVIKALANDGLHFKVVWQVTIVHTQVQSINHHHQSTFQHLTSHHMAQWVSNVDVTLATHHITITSTCFLPPTLHQW